MTLLTKTDQLNRFVQSVIKEGCSFIAVDCEFVRKTTYWPQLGLIQLATPGQSIMIDPLSKEIELSPLCQLLYHPNLIKVFHSGRQDIEIFYHLFQRCPAPLFDTQIAAGFLGFGESISYERLVKEILEYSLDKEDQYTNWLQRPLTPSQLRYAMGDVYHLQQLYTLLIQKLQKEGRQDWVLEESRVLANPDLYQNSPKTVWQKFKPPFSKWRFISVFWDLVTWRETQAQSLNLSRVVLAEHQLLVDLSQKPFLEKDVFQSFLKGYRQRILSLKLGDIFYECYRAAWDFMNSTDDRLEDRKQQIRLYFQEQDYAALSLEQKKHVKDLRLQLQTLADTLKIPCSFLAGRRDIESWVRCPHPGHKFLKGWRQKVLQETLEPFQAENGLQF